MKSARRAGWGCLGWGLSFIPFAVGFRYVAKITKAAPPLPTMCMFMFWFVAVMIVLCFLYAAWGLWVGYNRKAWERYERGGERAVKIGAIRECKRLGIDPPMYS